MRPRRLVPSVLGALLCSAVAAPGAVAACPNEGIRSEQGTTVLPDCRAYEMVTPAYKEGFEVPVDPPSSDGNSVVSSTLAELAKAHGSGEEPTTPAVYVATRTSAGWSLSPLNAPTTSFVGEMLQGQEPDDGATLWIQHEPSQPASVGQYWLRNAAGEYRRIGPAKPNETYEQEPSNALDTAGNFLPLPVASTANFAHIVTFARKVEERFGFDETEKTGGGFDSLYEYSGTDNERPILVGVNGEKESTDLVSRCGATLGSEGVAYNALSASGETVFFTALPCKSGPATAEIFARVHGAVSSPLAAETVNVSASECTSNCGPESGKHFEGASEDGGKVFFTSTQKLTDAAVDGTNDGDAFDAACPAAPLGTAGCNLYEYDFATDRLRVMSSAAEVLGVTGVAEDGSRVYYVSRASLGSAGANPSGARPVTGRPNLYAYNDETKNTAFVATLADADSADWQPTFLRPAQVAGPSGRFLVFESSAPALTPDEARSATANQLFEYKDESESEPAELVRVTKGEGGYDENGNGVTRGVSPSLFAAPNEPLGRERDRKSNTNRLSVSADGQTVAFVTAGQLSPRAASAIQGCNSVYEFRAPTTALAEGKVTLLSDGQDILSRGSGSECGAGLYGMDRSGGNIFFTSRDPLLGVDDDGLEADVYDARVDGGFPGAARRSVCGSISECEAFGPPPPATWPLASAIQSTEVAATPPAHSAPVQAAKPLPAWSLRSCRRRFHNRRRRLSCERAVRRHLTASHSMATRR